ncbi:MAG: AMP-binding protein [Alphaproteobacteria bacterium]
MNRAPGGASGHVDGFSRGHLPPREDWPQMDYSSLPELAAYPDRMNAAVELLEKTIERLGGGPTMIRYGDLRWSYDDLKTRVDRIAAVLVEDFGLVSGNRVMLRGPNNPMMAAAWLAIVKAGGVCVATMPLLRGRELAYMIEKAEITLALCDVSLGEEMRSARERAPIVRQISYFTAEGEAGEAGADLDTRMAGKSGPFEACDTAADDVALIAFTSGTTGQPKGTMHFHRDILAMCDCFARYTFGAGPQDVYTGSPPLAFTFGLGAQLAFPLRFGSSVVYLDRPPSPEALWETVQKYKCTTLYTAPVMFRALADMAAGYDISSLENCVSAGETLPGPIWEAFYEATGIRIIDGLGSTEMIHIFVAAPPGEMRPGYTGKAIAGYQARIVDDDGKALPPGEIGNLAVRGPTGCRYLDNPERQGAYVQGGWNLPGDVYLQTEDGYFQYQARADDMIISAGYNISGPEIEAVLLEHPSVLECAVIGAPDEKRGHIVKAFVVLREGFNPGEAAVKALQDFVKAEIAPYKYPRAIEFVAELPRTETGKMQRFKLRQHEEKKDQA